ncbi:MAG: hypothetical protein KDA58_06700, partial [Planctomycetaceae bacterium]|nr:hypothetical protein [Planctomycetaceae bacterium]
MTQSTPTPNLLGQETVLAHVRQDLEQSGRAALGPPLRMPTLRGWGLTSCAQAIAAETSARHVFHLSARSELRWQRDLVQLTRQLDLKERHLRRPGDPLLAVRRWLRQHDDWLLILDDVQQLDRIQPLIAPLEQGRILLLLQGPTESPENWPPVRSVAPLNALAS